MIVSKFKNFSKSSKVWSRIASYFELKNVHNIANCQKKMTTAQNGLCNKIVWMDLEMTGLDVQTDKILEVSCLITDEELNILSEGLCFAINHEKNVLENMNDWCLKHHNESGLVRSCLESKINMSDGEELLMKYLKKHIPKGQVPLAGNSIYMDRLFLRFQMPRVDEYLHYRLIDVSTIKELCRRWNPKVFKATPKKELNHRSLDDIKESIAELKYYRKNFFKNC